MSLFNNDIGEISEFIMKKATSLIDGDAMYITTSINGAASIKFCFAIFYLLSFALFYINQYDPAKIL